MKLSLYFYIHFISSIQAHSWLDCVDRREDGSCGGYIRNYQGHFDLLSSYKILDRNPETPLCDPRYQSKIYYTQEYPMTKSKIGKTLYFDYYENGHVNLDKLPPDNRPHPNFYSLYFNEIPLLSPDDNNQYLYRKDLFDKKPFKVAPFDDNECSDITYFGRTGPKPCLGNYTIPLNLKNGIYQLIWIWHFDRDIHSLGEEYVSCFDIEIISEEEYKLHQLKQFMAYSPIKKDFIKVDKVNCSQHSYDNQSYDCLNDILCPKNSKLCDNLQCYDDTKFQCCYDKFLLPLDQNCSILGNPFDRLKYYINKN